MHRLIAAAVAFALMTLAMAALTLQAAAFKPVRAPMAPIAMSPASPLSTRLDLYMAASETGAPQHSFLSNTVQAYAVLDYEGATNERYLVRVRDLSGITVKEKPVGPLNGAGKTSVLVNTGDFVTSYKARMAASSDTVLENVKKAGLACQSVPPVPNPWPPQPGPTPQPGTPPPPSEDPYITFGRSVLEPVAAVRSALADVTRTIQSVRSLPDILNTIVIIDLNDQMPTLNQAETELAKLPRLINPPGPTVDDPNPPKPKPQEGCQIIAESKARLEAALGKVAEAMAKVPADVSTWRMAPTTARFANQSFLGCVQYQVQLFRITGDRPNDTAAKTIAFSVGDPGIPALIFPGPDLVDASNVNQLAISPQRLYAKSVKVPNLVQMAKVHAYVTDDKCIAVTNVDISFGVDPSAMGTVSPASVAVVNGEAETTLTSGDEGTLKAAEVNATVCAGPCAAGGALPITARGRFTVVGPAKLLTFLVRPNTLNRLDPDAVKRGMGITIHATDHVTGGNSVADGTIIKVKVIKGPAQFAYDRSRVVNGVRGPIEQVPMGKTFELMTDNGNSVVPASTDPGFENQSRLYLIPDGNSTGCITIQAEADGTTADSDDRLADGRTRSSICVVSQNNIFLPLSVNKKDIRATPNFIPINPTATPTRRPR